MKDRFFALFSILLIFLGNTLPLVSSNLTKSELKNTKLTTDYLKQLPANDYIIGSGDTLAIIVSRDYNELNKIVSVDGEGTIYLPKLNRVYVRGLTLLELTKILNEAFLTFVKFPEVEVEVRRYRPIRVLVQGEVENPGLQTLSGALSSSQDMDEEKQIDDVSIYPINNRGSLSDLNDIQRRQSNRFYFPTVFDAIRQSGGITDYADLKRIQIIRNDNLSNGGGKISTFLNFEKVINSGDNTQNIRIYDSDVIRIFKSKTQNDLILRKSVLSNLNPKYIEVFVAGRVRKPGRTIVSKASVLSDAIDISGGTKALRGKLSFIRFNNDGSIDKRRFNFKKSSKRGSYNNPVLRNGDLIVVNENFMTITNEIITDITKPFVGVFSTYGLIKAIND